jgi:hypothetical protein
MNPPEQHYVYLLPTKLLGIGSAAKSKMKALPFTNSPSFAGEIQFAHNLTG